MAERKATNKYYPPEWDPSKGSINTFHGQHPLRQRARKLKTEGILVIRFEMPFNVWCTACKSHIGKGVRFNAEKKKIGNYFSTPIFQFKMKCPECPNYMEIETDPKNRDYKLVSGVEKKTEEFEVKREDGLIPLPSEEEKKQLDENPIFRLEYSLEDKKRSAQMLPVLERLKVWRDVRENDYELSYLARKKFRQEKKMLQHEKEEAEKKGFSSLLPPTKEDSEIAENVEFKKGKDVELQKIKSRLQIKGSSIFPKNDSTSNNTTSTPSQSNSSVMPPASSVSSVSSISSPAVPTKKRSAQFFQVLAEFKRARKK